MIEHANAQPRKRFFLEMFTRDIFFEDCILDLIDNSIDALARSQGMDLSPPLLADLASPASRSAKLAEIDISYSDTQFEISDNCGGIHREEALSEVFSFGHSPGYAGGQLGVYGIGLKRALFKVGRYFTMHSRTIGDGFKVALDIDEWAKRDSTPDDWKIPLEGVVGAKSQSDAGTKITISRLTDEVKARLRDNTLENTLHRAIGTTYAIFLNRGVKIRVKGKEVAALEIPVGTSQDVKAAIKDWTIKDGLGDVRVKLIASLAARSRGEWSSERAGWYVLCNNRVILPADKSEVTGWNAGMPKFHSKYNGFVGLAFFQSKVPSLLPWTTTKRGVNRDSVIFQKVRPEMLLISRGIVTFLNDMYPSEMYEQPPQRDLADHVTATTLASLATTPPSDFKYTLRDTKKSTVRVQYDAEKSDIDRIKRHLKRSTWGARRVGEYTFKHFLENECEK